VIQQPDRAISQDRIVVTRHRSADGLYHVATLEDCRLPRFDHESLLAVTNKQRSSTPLKRHDATQAGARIGCPGGRKALQILGMTQREFRSFGGCGLGHDNVLNGLSVDPHAGELPSLGKGGATNPAHGDPCTRQPDEIIGRVLGNDDSDVSRPYAHINACPAIFHYCR
jgi:hypothetical protein